MRNRPLLVLHQGAIGDFIMTFPALERLKRRFGSLHAICPGSHGRLAEGLGLVDRWYPAEAAAFASLYSGDPVPRVREILASGEAMLLFSSSMELADGLRSIAPIPIYRVDPLPDAARRIPVFRYLLDSLATLGLVTLPGGKAPWHSPTEFSGLAEMPPQPGVVFIHPGAGSKRKRWPLDRFFVLADMLEAGGLRPEFLIGPAEEEIESAVIRHRQGRFPVIRIERLVDLAATLRSVTGYIGNDAGVTHLAAFIGLPTVAIFGPADPERWAPLGPKAVVLRPPVDCEPCFELLPDNCDGDFPDCLYDTYPETVIRAFMMIS